MSILGDKILEGPVTIGLVTICFAVCMVVIGVFTYFSQRFQTKVDADKAEVDMKAWIRKVENDVSKMQTSLETIGNNVSYIRGRLDPSTQTKT